MTPSPSLPPKPVRACVLISPPAEGWHNAVEAAVHERGTSNQVLITSDIDEAIAFAPDHWAVLTPPFDSSGDVDMEANRIRDISRAFATAADAAGNVAVVDAQTLKHKRKIDLLPGLPLSLVREQAPDAVLGDLPDALEVYRRGHPRPGDRADWSLNLFHLHPSAERNINDHSEFDITGRLRILAWGPHIFLPRGTWRVRLRFEVDDAAARQSFTFDWGPLSAYKRFTVRPAGAGVYEAVIDKRWDVVEVTELRVGPAHAAFSGRMILLSVTIERIEDEQTDAAALGGH